MEDDEDQQLLQAAAHWADDDGNNDEEDSENSSEPQSPPQHARNQKNKKYSLHVTQLSYEATDYDVRDLFVTKGCLVTSVRLVRPDGQFKGVAFVDVQDAKSYEIGLQCHRMFHLGRKINVRPVLSKEELTKIALATQEKVQDIIQKSTENGSSSKSSTPNKKTSKPPVKESSSKKNSKFHYQRRKGKDADRKITKKERNRKAAILAQKKKGNFKKGKPT
jgi:RNA recognition motif-containing protein